MESIFVVAVILWIMSAISAAAKKQQAQQKKAAQPGHSAAFPTPVKAAAPKKAAVPNKAAVQTAMSLDDGIPDGPEHPLVAPRIAPRVQLTRETPDMFSGSMNADTHEGEDPCHEAELSPVKSARPERIALTPTDPIHHEEHSGFVPDVSRDGLVQAFVMQEILTRPCDRRRRA